MRFLIGFTAVSIIALLFLSFSTALASSYDEAASAITYADNALRDAFVKVSDAESGGANVSALVIRLSGAGDKLTAAVAALNSEDYEGAVNTVNNCLSLSSNISNDAIVIRNDAVASASKWWIPVIISSVASAVFVALLLLVWSKFKGSYKAKLMESKPEVNQLARFYGCLLKRL